MNYFELHIGDLTEATAHLSMLEDGAYGRLLRKYYATEKPLPADIRQVQRLVGARSKEEREAVEAVLQEFFELQDDGWHQQRCDAEIAAFHEKQAGKEGKRENAKDRQRRARERRSSLFEFLRGHGIVAPWSTTTAELETLASRVTSGETSQPVTPSVTRDDTASQTPDTSPQTPEIQRAQLSSEESTPPPGRAPGSGSPYGLAVLAMRQQGMDKASPGDPRLRALVDAGVSLEEFQAAAREAVDKGKGFAWALVALQNRRAELAAKPIAAAPVEDWRESRAGVDTKARELGLPIWSEWEDQQVARGIAPQYPAYRRSVLQAAAAATGAAA